MAKLFDFVYQALTTEMDIAEELVKDALQNDFAKSGLKGLPPFLKNLLPGMPPCRKPGNPEYGWTGWPWWDTPFNGPLTLMRVFSFSFIVQIKWIIFSCFSSFSANDLKTSLHGDPWSTESGSLFTLNEYCILNVPYLCILFVTGNIYRWWPDGGCWDSITCCHHFLW